MIRDQIGEGTAACIVEGRLRRAELELLVLRRLPEGQHQEVASPGLRRLTARHDGSLGDFDGGLDRRRDPTRHHPNTTGAADDARERHANAADRQRADHDA